MCVLGEGFSLPSNPLPPPTDAFLASRSAFESEMQLSSSTSFSIILQLFEECLGRAAASSFGAGVLLLFLACVVSFCIFDFILDEASCPADSPY